MTRSMARWTRAGCIALAALSAAAVLGVGSRAAVADPSASPFAGDWSGTWTVVERGVEGTYDWTISDTGRIEGTVSNTTLEDGGAVVGHVGDDGNFNITGYAPNGVPGSGFSGFHFQGTAEIDGDGKLVVSAVGLGENPATRPSLAAILERN